MQIEEGTVNELPCLKQLMMALPGENDKDPAGEKLAAILNQVPARKVPVSSFSRLWILGSLHAKVALGYLTCWLRSRFAEAGEKERLRNEAHLTAALQLLGTMGYMRGAVMKLGQLLASLPLVVPEEFARTLASLHFQAPPMHYSVVREVFLDEFGREPEELFASFERRAFAAASLGQVHRARLHSGEEVAVKVQYPDIARTIKSDLRNLRILLQPMCMTADWHNHLEKLADIEEMLMMETDYQQEARFGREIRNNFTSEDRIVVPRIYEEYSTRRVLTTEYLCGVHLDQFLAADPDQELRDHFTHLITAATMRLLYRSHWLLADPNPGNYIFMDDGRLGLIDFGCTRVITDEEWRLQREFERAVINRDEAGINRAIARACLYNDPEEMEPERLAVVGRGALWQMEPWKTEGLFDFGDEEFFRRGIDTFLDVMRRRYDRGKPLYLWTNRFVLGARGITFRLKGRCDFRKIYEQESDACL
ncbi:MAG: AarF/ABC1/UbiB kinase family protein [Geobacter sp.]|nr:AarF/ABC1/UbiB kinase family protein [Geobacter sp.]